MLKHPDFTAAELKRHKLTLFPCPKCNSQNLEIGGDDSDGDVICHNCGLITPVCYGTKSAISIWNKRDNWQNWSIFSTMTL